MQLSKWNMVGVTAVLAILAQEPKAHAQTTCGSPPSNVVAASGACGPVTRITWTNPAGGLVFPKVWRSSTTNFADAVLVYNPGLGGPTTFADLVPAINTIYFYWVGGDIVGCSSNPPVASIPMVGPNPAGVFLGQTFPAPEATAACNGIALRLLPVWDATAMKVFRVASGNSSFEDIGNLSPLTATWTDTNTRPGNSYTYATLPQGNGCGDGFGFLSANVRAGPVNAAIIPGTSVRTGATASLTVVSGFGPGEPVLSPTPTSYQWLRNNIPLSNGGRISGSQTRTLVISNARLEDAGAYSVRILNSCNASSPFIASGVLSVTQVCRADFDQDGSAGVGDIFSYLSTWFAGCP